MAVMKPPTLNPEGHNMIPNMTQFPNIRNSPFEIRNSIHKIGTPSPQCERSEHSYSPGGRGGRHAHRPGAVLILIVVSLALLMLMGFAYMQIAFTDRQASNEFESHADSVAGDVIGYVLGELTRDVFTTGPNRPEPYDYPTNAYAWGGTAGAGQFGVYDDLWLASTTPDFTDPVNPVWPKITYLDFDPTQRGFLSQWSQNWATAPGDTNPPDPTTHQPGQFTIDTPTILPADSVIQASPADTDVALNPLTNALVDADGDGIPDSRWQYAPTRSYGDVDYVVAVRIIDNSSLININLATALTDDGIAVDTADNKRPRGWFPTEVDASRLLSRALVNANAAWPSAVSWNSGSPDVQSQWTQQLLPFTGMNPISSPPNVPLLFNAPLTLNNWQTTYTAGNSRLNLWMELGRYYGYETRLFDRNNDRTAESTERFRRFGSDSEEELRYRGGLNNTQVVRPPYTSQIEGPIPLPLRANWPASSSGTAPNESHFRRVVEPGAGATTLDHYAQWFEGHLSGGVPTPDIINRRFPDVRKFLTTVSGAMAMRSTDADFDLKYDLVHQDGGATLNNTARITNMATILRTIFQTGNAGFKYLALGDPPLNELATQYALAIADYSDNDNVPSKATIGTVDYYGLEGLPILREAYVQVAFTGQDLWDGVGAYSVNGSDGRSDTWSRQPNSDGFAIELGNPFDHEINLDAIRLLVGGATFSLPPSTTIPAREHIVVYYNPVADTDDEGTYTLNNLVTSLSIGGTSVAATLDSGTLNLATGADLTVRLQVDTNADIVVVDLVTYDRLTGSGFSVDSAVFTATAVAEQGDTATRGRHAQTAVYRACSRPGGAADGIYYLSNLNKEVKTRVLPVETAYNTTMVYFNNDDKGSPVIEGDQKLDAVQIPHANRPIFSVAELGWIFKLGFSRDTAITDDEADTGDLPQRLSGADGTGGILTNGWDNNSATTVDNGQLFLDISPNAVVPRGLAADRAAVQHAAMVLEQFTTLSPAHDDVNNSDSSPDATPDDDPPLVAGKPAERFVPGMININTMPLHLLTLAAPIPEDSIREIQDLMETIVRYRNLRPWDSSVTYNRGDRVFTVTGTTPNLIWRTYMSIADSNVGNSVTSTAHWLPVGERHESNPASSWGRVTPGLATLGEWLFLNPQGGTYSPPNYTITTPGDYPRNILRYGYDGVNNSGNPSLLYPLPEDGGTYQAIIDDPVQRLARYQFLSQIFTTRSDVFTMYIHVRGYRRGEFTGSPVETARYIVVLDRSNVMSATDSPKVLLSRRIQ